jgi:hypothetical protein
MLPAKTHHCLLNSNGASHGRPANAISRSVAIDFGHLLPDQDTTLSLCNAAPTTFQLVVELVKALAWPALVLMCLKRIETERAGFKESANLFKIEVK